MIREKKVEWEWDGMKFLLETKKHIGSLTRGRWKAELKWRSWRSKLSLYFANFSSSFFSHAPDYLYFLLTFRLFCIWFVFVWKYSKNKSLAARHVVDDVKKMKVLLSHNDSSNPVDCVNLVLTLIHKEMNMTIMHTYFMLSFTFQLCCEANDIVAIKVLRRALIIDTTPRKA